MQMRKIPMAALAELLQVQLEKGGKAKLTVTGNSMQPMFCHGRDSVMLVPLSEKQKTGDIILYRRKNGQYILHRILELTETGYMCCGDNQTEKETVEQEQLIAVVESFTRKGKDHTLDDWTCRLYTAVWLGCFPLRKCYVTVRRTGGKILRKLKRLKKRK